MKTLFTIISVLYFAFASAQVKLEKELVRNTNLGFFQDGITQIAGISIIVYGFKDKFISFQNTPLNLSGDTLKNVIYASSSFDSDEKIEFLVNTSSNKFKQKLSLFDDNGTRLFEFDTLPGYVSNLNGKMILVQYNYKNEPWSYKIYSLFSKPISTKSSTLKSAKLNAYPNPTDGNISITGYLPKPILVINSSGQMVKIINPSENVDLSDLNPDTYILNNGEQSIKIVIR